MKSRCNNPNTCNFKYYGGRGIAVCEEWQHDYGAFRAWSLANGYQEGLSIDRIDVNGNYCPENCRWVTKKVQQMNKRNTLYATIDGEKKTIREWSKIKGISYSSICNRIYSLGWTPEEAVAVPIGKKRGK
jgi:TusA-related sulfurtransferase